MKRSILLLTLLTIGACSDHETPDEIAVLVAEEVKRTANARSFWPRFEPMAIPLAIYDGEHTRLFWHPEAPVGFTKAEDNERSGLVYSGRHPAMTANSTADIGGTMTATLLVDDVKPGQSLVALAGIAIHEAFHVFQRQRHPEWAANEGALFMYPVDSPVLLSLRRMETEALRRALEMSDPLESECWTRLALSLRAERLSEMDAQFAEYERGTELNEGLATYVQHKADERGTVTVPTGGFGATEVRPRAYVTGAAFAMLLDRINSGWRAQFDADGRQSLDQTLQSNLTSRARTPGDTCEFTAAETLAASQRALSDVAAVEAARNERRTRFDHREAWRLVVKAEDGKPLQPQGFDPLNVERVQGGILHTRFLRLGNDQGYLEVIDTGDVDIEALTVGAGPHPLFDGIEEVTIVGFVEQELTAGDDYIFVQIPGLKVEFRPASIQRNVGETVIQLKQTQ